VQETLLTFPDLRDHGIKYTRVHLNRLMARGQFPQAIWLSPNRKVWLAREIEEFNATRPTTRPRGAG
jgi:predicted DNA-binding transcriptional regulator AlpA